MKTPLKTPPITAFLSFTSWFKIPVETIMYSTQCYFHYSLTCSEAPQKHPWKPSITSRGASIKTNLIKPLKPYKTLLKTPKHLPPKPVRSREEAVNHIRTQTLVFLSLLFFIQDYDTSSPGAITSHANVHWGRLWWCEGCQQTQAI